MYKVVAGENEILLGKFKTREEALICREKYAKKYTDIKIFFEYNSLLDDQNDFGGQ